MSRAHGKTQKIKTVRCPTCRQIVMPKAPEFPFCNERCRSIDLGKWASGEYRISSPILDPDVLEGLGELGKSGSGE